MKHLCKEQYTDVWWAARRGRPTASQASRILTPKTLKPSKSQSAYINELIGDLYDPAYPRVDDFQSAAMKNGTMIEPEARDFLAFEAGHDIEQVGLIGDDHDKWAASPDGLIGDDRGCEIKSPTHRVHTAYLRYGKVPDDYLPQIHASMVVTGLDTWLFMSYARKMPHLLIEVKRDDYTKKLEDEMYKFWDKYQTALQFIRDLDRGRVEGFEAEQEQIAVDSTF